jgi:hypothetical protein
VVRNTAAELVAPVDNRNRPDTAADHTRSLVSATRASLRLDQAMADKEEPPHSLEGLPHAAAAPAQEQEQEQGPARLDELHNADKPGRPCFLPNIAAGSRDRRRETIAEQTR